MSTFGVQSSGFVVKRLADIVDSLKSRLQAVNDGNGNTISVDPEDSSLVSQLTMIFAENLSEAWAMAGALANQFDPNYNLGPFQSGVVQLNGIFRKSNIPTTIAVSCTGTGGMTIPAGTSLTYNNNAFLTVADISVGVVVAATGTITIAAQPADGTQLTIGGVTYTWKTGGPVAAYDIYSQASLSSCATHLKNALNLSGTAGVDYGTGTYAHPLVSGSTTGAVVTVTARATGSNGNTIALASQTINVTTSSMTGGTDFGTGTGTATSVDTVPIVVPDGASMSVATPVAGLQTATCTSTPVAGVAIESDEALRIRQQASTQLTAAREVDAILSAVNNVNGVTHAQIYENPTTSPVTVNGVSVPAGRIYVVVVGGLDSDVADAIYSRLSCMTQTGGNTSKAYGTITINFERPIPALVGVSIVAAQRGSTFPTDFATQIQNAIANWATSTAGYIPGQTVFANDLYDPLVSFPWLAPRDAIVGAPGFMYGNVQATGNFVFANNGNYGATPSDYNGLTVTVGSKTYTFTDAAKPLSGANLVSTYNYPVDPARSTATTAAYNLASAINAVPAEAGYSYGIGTTFNTNATASASGGKTYVTAIDLGAAGNSIALASSNNTIIAKSGTTLSGGVTGGAGGGAKSYPISGDYIAVFNAANIVVTRPLAAGTITFTANPANNDTVTVNGKVYTFQASVTNVNGNVLIGGNKYMTAANLALAINLTGSTGTGAGNFNYAASMTINAYVSAVDSSNVVTVTDKTSAGAAGNAFTLAKSSSNITLSGATLAGGEG